MSRTKFIELAIDRFLENDTPSVLCISGKWGVGKTFLWQEKMRKAVANGRLGLNRYSYVSLFGLSSLDDLKSSIFENTNTLTNHNEWTSALSELGKKSRGLAESIPYVGKWFEKNSERLWFLTVRNSFVCIDDLERAGGSLRMRDVLGLASFLKEQRKCKVVILLNEEELDDAGKEELSKYLEKVVDLRMVFEPDAQDSVRIALVGEDAITKQIAECVVHLGISNIRVIKKIEKVIHDVWPLVADLDEYVRRQSIQSLVLLGWSHHQPNLAPTIKFLSERRGVISKKEFTPEESKWSALLDAYPFRDMDELDGELLGAIRNGYVNEEKLRAKAVTLNDTVLAQRRDSSLEDAWNLYNLSFEDNEQEVLDRMYEALKQSVQSVTPLNLDATIRLFRDLGHNDKANELLDWFMANRIASDEFWSLEDDSFGNVLDAGVRAAFAAKHTKSSAALDPVDVLRRLSASSLWTAEEFEALAALSVDDFYRIFKGHTGRDLRKIINTAFIFERFANPTEEMNQIAPRAREALRRIGAESPLNRRRVQRYGINVATEDDSASDDEDELED